MKQLSICLSIFGLFFLISCNKNTEKAAQKPNNPLFTLMSSSATGIDFVNKLEYDKTFNIYKYRNFYNGGGVAVGDVNNDGLPDVYMSSNMKHNKLYLNKGNFKFEDVTDKAGCAGTKSWATGVTMVDINADGWLDIYVCNSGDRIGGSRENELFVNNQNGTFTEKATEYGLADKGLSTHATFFDADNDGDLDCYLLNNSFRAIGSFNLQKNLRDTRDSLGGHKLFRNDSNTEGGVFKPKFTDISAEAGIYGSVQAFGLGVMVGDINKDGWQDIYVCNDFFERDYLYINQKNGKFSEEFEKWFNHGAAASMGADLADINNDALPDVFNTEMLPHGNRRLKQKTTFDNWNRYKYYVVNGYHHQFTHNSFQVNNGNGSFSEVAFSAGMAATDWSWGALMCDLDNDGWKDIFIANGIYQELTDQDFIQFIANQETAKQVITGEGVDWKKLIDAIPSEAIPNFAYRNNGDLSFTNQAFNWGLADPSFSNGAAYADLDNDGDLDLVVNNTNMEAFVYRNEARNQLKDNHFLQFVVKGEGQNINALGTKITAFANGQTLYVEQMPMRGFQSSMDYRPHLGLGKITQVDSLVVDFPNGKRTILKNIKADQTLTLNQKDATLKTPQYLDTQKPILENTTAEVIDFKHIEDNFSDFDVERLKFMMHSTEGPKIAVGDVNGDKLDDVYIGGAIGQVGQLFIQKGGKLTPSVQNTFTLDRQCEDVGATFFDADGDKDLDLFVASGGSDGQQLGDRLYKNDGKGNFSRDPAAFSSQKPFATSVARPADFDGDGDMDLFIGGRLIPSNYGKKVGGYLLQNDGQGHFTGVTDQRAPELRNLAMVTDAQWADVDNDKDVDLVVVGEWMPITVFKNDGGKFFQTTTENGLLQTAGLWNTIQLADLDKDGDLDFICGNLGTNSRFHASPKEPMTMYYGDFDGNEAYEQLFCLYDNGKSYTCALRSDLTSQMPIFKKKYPDFKSYSDQTIEQVLSKDQMGKATKHEAQTVMTSVVWNNGNGKFTCQALPAQAQYAPVYAILAEDFDKDGVTDLMLLGNFFEAKPEIGRMDANYGLILRGGKLGDKGQVTGGSWGFEPMPYKRSNMNIRGQVRDVAKVKVGGKDLVFVVQNNDKTLVFKGL
jgi:enediyne biosynthesis protein E4